MVKYGKADVSYLRGCRSKDMAGDSEVYGNKSRTVLVVRLLSVETE